MNSLHKDWLGWILVPIPALLAGGFLFTINLRIYYPFIIGLLLVFMVLARLMIRVNSLKEDVKRLEAALTNIQNQR